MLKSYKLGTLPNYELAIKEYKQAITIDPYNPMVYSNLGYVYYDIGDMDNALKYQKKCLEIDPNFANAHYGLALVYKSFDDKAAAIKHWKKYLNIELSGYYSRKAKSGIKALQQTK